MSRPVITDQVDVRFSIGAGLLLLLTGFVVALPLAGFDGFTLLLVATALLATALDRRHALMLATAGWAFATGFAVNTLGVLTTRPADLLRLAVFLFAARLAAGRSGPL